MEKIKVLEEKLKNEIAEYLKLLPLGVGSTIFCVYPNYRAYDWKPIEESVVTSIDYFCGEASVMLSHKCPIGKGHNFEDIEFELEEIGKYIFLTRTEAEVAYEVVTRATTLQVIN